MSLTESHSADSSSHHSGLTISVGDTKSIVLALQALQSKIRQLEKDRDHHHDQYEKAIDSHETFKVLMEDKMNEERASHKRREKELSDLLRQALEERSKINGTLLNGRDSLAQLREEMQSLILSEKRNAEEREEKLRLEIRSLQHLMKQEKLEHAAALMKVEELHKERDLARQQNESLRLSLTKVTGAASSPRDGGLDVNAYTRQSNVTGGCQPPVVDRSGPSDFHTSVSHAYHHHHHLPINIMVEGANLPAAPTTGTTSLAAHNSHHHHHTTTDVPRAAAAPHHAHSSDIPAGNSYYDSGYDVGYRDPTCNSMLRDVRNVSGVSPCAHPSCNVSGMVPELPPEDRTLAPPPPPPPLPLATSSARAKPHRSDSSRNVTPMKRSSSRTAQQRSEQSKMSEMSLLGEIEDLKRQLQRFAASPQLSSMSVEEMNLYFKRISLLIDRKEEQLHLLRTARNRQPRTAARQSLMNEIRAIASKSTNRR